MKNEPETYEELIIKKRCIDITKYYEVTEEELEKIYQFLKENPGGEISGNTQSLNLINEGNTIPIDTIVAKCLSNTIDGIKVSNKNFTIIPHYNPSRGGYSSGGSSSNNNNNKNNNNNNNNTR